MTISISEYEKTLKVTKNLPLTLNKNSQQRILVYGLSSEIGSLVSRLKKWLIKHSDLDIVPDTFVKEELSDILWYLTALANHLGYELGPGIFLHNLRAIRGAFYPESERTTRSESIQQFCTDLEGIEKSGIDSFDDFQRLATATRWQDEDTTFLHTSVAFATYAAQQLLLHDVDQKILERHSIENIESQRKSICDIAWYVANIASTFQFKLSEIAEYSSNKTNDRYNVAQVTPHHDEKFLRQSKEHFPRQMEIAFLTNSKGKAQMFWDGRPLGDALTDNAPIEDGYRFHDALHLANVAVLGWSPVIRALMGLKRKSCAETDENEDGARARIVDEMVIKLIHGEGIRLAKSTNVVGPYDNTNLFQNKEDVSFTLLQQIKTHVDGLEVSGNKTHEWISSIHQGYRAFDKLSKTGRGTLSLDLIARTIAFSSDVWVDMVGPIIGNGLGVLEHYKGLTSATELIGAHFNDYEKNGPEHDKLDSTGLAEMLAIKEATLKALFGNSATKDTDFREITVSKLSETEYRIYLAGSAQQRAEERDIVSFSIAVSSSENLSIANVSAMTI